ncbi:MAG TPA: hypothetical protein VGN72_06215 [Tepidisphaeraceae bacterium]|jgi:hypothetical protein|nr:hypothetical protein [Tepidisphaeraceae bacterium]
MRTLRLLTIALLFIGTVGCAQQAKRVAEKAAPAGAKSTLQELSSPENKAALDEVATRLSAAVAKGLVQGLMGEVPNDADLPAEARQLVDRAPGLSGQIVDSVMQAVARGLDQHLSPAISRAIEQNMTVAGGAIERELAPAIARGTRTAVSQLASELAATMEDDASRAVVAGYVQEIAPAIAEPVSSAIGQGLERQIGPALARTVDEQLGPTIRKTVEAETAALMEGTEQAQLTQALSGTSRAMSRETFLGLRDALVEMNVLGPDNQPGSLLIGRSGLLGQGLSLIMLTAIVLGLIVLGLIIWLAIVLTRSRRARAEAERREASTRLLAEAIRATESERWHPELRRILHDRMRHTDDHALRDLITAIDKGSDGQPAA